MVRLVCEVIAATFPHYTLWYAFIRLSNTHFISSTLRLPPACPRAHTILFIN
ncbi:hypothetical protein [Terrimonas alba]|uniref:hypothetical protein n=1 Tax=Terrimonas alba TaxID=3349636 RepID=UPI0035F23E6A